MEIEIKKTLCLRTQKMRYQEEKVECLSKVFADAGEEELGA